MTTLKVTQPVTYSRVLGVGGVRGERVVTNDDIAGPINSSDEWIRQRTGIVTRRRAAEDPSLLDMCEGAGRADGGEFLLDDPRLRRLQAQAPAGLRPGGNGITRGQHLLQEGLIGAAAEILGFHLLGGVPVCRQPCAHLCSQLRIGNRLVCHRVNPQVAG